jgi:hypothetical protein
VVLISSTSYGSVANRIPMLGSTASVYGLTPHPILVKSIDVATAFALALMTATRCEFVTET